MLYGKNKLSSLCSQLCPEVAYDIHLTQRKVLKHTQNLYFLSDFGQTGENRPVVNLQVDYL